MKKTTRRAPPPMGQPTAELLRKADAIRSPPDLLADKAKAAKPARKRVIAAKPAAKGDAIRRARPAVKSTPDAIARVMPAVEVLALTDFEAEFVREYLVDRNGTQAYMRIRPTAGPKTAANEAWLLLRKPLVAGAIAGAMAAMRRNADIDAEGVVRKLCGMAGADEREIMEVRVASCRYCWGEGNRYHYTAAEFERAEAAHAAAVEEEKASGDFDPKGGIGYNANLPPSPDCPECFGDGMPRAVFKDTRHLSEGAALLYAGVKVTRDGFEIKTHSRETAIVNLGRHFGIFDDKLKLGGKVEIDATKEMLDFLRERGSRLPIATKEA